jgi:hypothetical protein
MTESKSKRRVLGKVRPTALLDPETERRLSAYASAAMAAGVGLLAFTQPADAKIVYTPADIKISVNGAPVILDLNHDGSPDFSLMNSVATNSGVFRSFLRAKTVNEGNAVWGKGFFRGINTSVFASVLRPGSAVGPSRGYFQKGSRWLMWYGRSAPSARSTYWAVDYPSAGQWDNTHARYLGIKFIIAGQIHYGWARLNVGPHQFRDGIQATLTGYAYETTPNKPIITGKTKGPDVITLEPATLGRLAQGASGMSATQQKK